MGKVEEELWLVSVPAGVQVADLLGEWKIPSSAEANTVHAAAIGNGKLCLREMHPLEYKKVMCLEPSKSDVLGSLHVTHPFSRGLHVVPDISAASSVREGPCDELIRAQPRRVEGSDLKVRFHPIGYTAVTSPTLSGHIGSHPKKRGAAIVAPTAKRSRVSRESDEESASEKKSKKKRDRKEEGESVRNSSEGKRSKSSKEMKEKREKKSKKK